MPTKPQSPAIQRLVHRIKNLRLAAGQTQEHVAEKAGIAYKYYQEIEGGRRTALRLTTLERLAEHYGLELDDLFGRNAVPPTVRVKSSKEKSVAVAPKRAKAK